MPCPICDGPLPQYRKDQKFCSRKCFRQSEYNKRQPDPTLDEIRLISLEIRNGWSDETL